MDNFFLCIQPSIRLVSEIRKTADTRYNVFLSIVMRLRQRIRPTTNTWVYAAWSCRTCWFISHIASVLVVGSIRCHMRTTISRIHCSDTGIFLRISRKLRPTDGYLYNIQLYNIFKNSRNWKGQNDSTSSSYTVEE